MKKVVMSLIFIIMLTLQSFASVEGGEQTVDRKYENTFEAEISGYSHKRDGNTDTFGYDVPFKIHFNNEYKTRNGNPITVDECALIDGVPTLYTTINADAGGDLADCSVIVRCYTSNDVYTDTELSGMSSLVKRGITKIKWEPLFGGDLDEFFEKNKVQSIEVWINECDYEKK